MVWGYNCSITLIAWFVSFVAFLLSVKIRATLSIRFQVELYSVAFGIPSSLFIILLFWCHPTCPEVCVENLFTSKLFLKIHIICDHVN